jgi:adenylate cyclase
MANQREVREDQRQPTSDEVRAYLRVLLDRTELNASQRNRQFLSYVVEETLAGRGGRLTGYNIGLAVFGRSADFNPTVDPIVRIEASRLRRSLEHYYLTAGTADPIRIGIPKGAYVPSISYREHGPKKEEEALTGSNLVSPAAPMPSPVDRPPVPLTSGLAGFALLLALCIAGVYMLRDAEQGTLDTADPSNPSVLVVPLEYTSGDATRSFIARGLTYDIISSLTRLDDINVFAPGVSSTRDSSNGAKLAEGQVKPDLILSGSVQTSGSRLRVSILVADGISGRYLWSSVIERDVTTASLVEVQHQIAEQVATRIAQLRAIR